MTEPARSWVTGYGSVLVPRPPFEVARRAGDAGVILAHHGASGLRSLLVQPNPLVKSAEQGAPTRVALGPKTADLSEVLAFVEKMSFVASWSIVARADSDAAAGGSTFCCAFPSGTTLWSTPWDVPWPFELTAGSKRRDEMVYLQGPFAGADCPSFDELVGEGMMRTDGGQLDSVAGTCDWLELRYTFDAAEWRQRRAIVPLGAGLAALVTSQAAAASSPAAFEAAAEIVRTLALCVEAG
jgi:hypothetical protein